MFVSIKLVDGRIFANILSAVVGGAGRARKESTLAIPSCSRKFPVPEVYCVQEAQLQYRTARLIFTPALIRRRCTEHTTTPSTCDHLTISYSKQVFNKPFLRWTRIRSLQYVLLFHFTDTLYSASDFFGFKFFYFIINQ